MTPLQEEALWASAEHWLDNWNHPYTADVTGQACPCCQSFYDASRDQEERCDGCPIAEYTGEQDCDGTPWASAQFSHTRLSLLPSDPHLATAKEQFEQEYRFLVALALGEEP